MSKKHPKGRPGQPKPKPDCGCAQNHKTGIGGDVHVCGEILIEPSPARKKWRLEVASFVVLTLYAAVTFWQGCSTRKAASATESAANTAADTLKNQQHSFEIDQRPYIVSASPSFTSLPLRPSVPVYANVTFKNIGRTPATKFVGSVALERFELGPRGKVGQAKLIEFTDAAFAELHQKVSSSLNEINESHFERDIAPGDNSWSTSETPMQLSKPDMIPPKVGIYFLGLVSYSDSFKNTYDTEFCYFVFPSDPKWRICDSHNTIK